MSTYSLHSGLRKGVQRAVIITAAVIAGVAAAAAPVILESQADAAAAAGTQTVLETDVTRQVENTLPTNNWVLYTRVGTPPTAATFVEGPANPPLGVGSLEFTTVTGSEKAFIFNYDHDGTKLSDVNDISYSTYRSAGAEQQATALNVQVDYNGAAEGGFTTLVFEPIYNTNQGPVTSGEWQKWIADGSGIWWSTRPINGQCAGATSVCDKTWDEIVANNPDATVLAAGINQGSGNPSLVSAVDAFTFDETTYDFEPGLAPTSKEACKNDGWKTFDRPEFKNQGQCVSFVAAKKG